jgi:6-phosphogluconate dehydrogenase
MNLIKAASAEHEWHIDLSEMARIWKGGCIIRAAFLDRIKNAYKGNPALMSLLMDEAFAKDMVRQQCSWSDRMGWGVTCTSICFSRVI